MIEELLLDDDKKSITGRDINTSLYSRWIQELPQMVTNKHPLVLATTTRIFSFIVRDNRNMRPLL
jgi:hypothetical protein